MPHLSSDQIKQITESIDRRSDHIIYWDDFLKFLEHEGEMREMINDMRINQPGTTYLKEQATYKVSRGPG